MDVAGVREALHKQPFAPFTVRLADGRAVAVPHPDFVAVSSRRVIVVAEDGSWSVVEPLLIVSIDYESPSNGNDSGRSRRR